ncbi:MAG: ATP-dependent helicase [Longimicrobiales bacterium]|nr:ATP-dependent helicase [Longimicrobiales bacterium]
MSAPRSRREAPPQSAPQARSSKERPAADGRAPARVAQGKDEAGSSPSLRGLNPAQRLAAATLEGPVLVIAGAGTGKTRTLVHRLARLTEAGVSAESILLLTFTRRAAEEMIRRATQLMGEDRGRVAGGTFHSFGNLMLRRHGRTIGLDSRFTVLDQADTFEILSNLRTDLGLGGRGRSFPRRETIAAILSKAVNHRVAVKEILKREYPHLVGEAKRLGMIAERYRAYKSERGMVDFDDLLVLLIRLLGESDEARSHVHDRFRYVMIDEYQDTNILQAEITRLLAGAQRNLMVVGDDAQSIYAFRGACFQNLFDFHREFEDARVVTLEENYRSTQPILDLANALMGQMSRSFRKRLFTERGDGELPLLVEARDEREQARWVAAEIKRLHAGDTPLSEIAVLFRASYHAFPLELELGRLKIPYVKYGGFRFMDSAHIKDVLAPLRVVANPSDDLSLGRALLMCRGIGRAGARKLNAAAAGQANASNLAAALLDNARGKTRESLQPLARLLDALGLGPKSPAECIRLAVEYYVPILKERFDDWPKRQRDLEQLVAICRPYRSLESLLADLAIEPPNAATAGEVLAAPEAAEDGGRRGKATLRDHLVLSTIHSAKGLEWKAVVIIQALDGCIPMISDPFGEDPDDDKLDEDLRLLYVAVTRAKDRLAISWPRSTARGFGFGWADESRFVANVKHDLLDRRRAVDLLRVTGSGSTRGRGAGRRRGK